MDRPTKKSSHAKISSRVRAGLLRELASAPLSEFPDALAQCLAVLSAFGVGPGSAFDDTIVAAAGDQRGGIGVFRARLNSAPPRASASAAREWAPSPQVRHICGVIRANYDQPLSVECLAARVGRNTAYIATLFRRQMGMTIHRYLTRIRMRRAATLLRRSEKVEAVMLLVGYRSKKNFYRQFGTAFGVTPGVYKVGHAQLRQPRTRQ